jgi:hypothetical protein
VQELLPEGIEFIKSQEGSNFEFVEGRDKQNCALKVARDIAGLHTG